MQPLWSWRIVDHSYFESMGFVDLKACKFDDRWRSLENTIRSDSVECVVLRNRIGHCAFAAVDKFLLHFQYVSCLRNG